MLGVLVAVKTIRVANRLLLVAVTKNIVFAEERNAAVGAVGGVIAAIYADTIVPKPPNYQLQNHVSE